MYYDNMTWDLRRLGIVLSTLGVIIAAYLLYGQLTLSPIICGITSCGVVAGSKYAAFLGVPVAAWGLSFYTAVAIFFYLRLNKFLLVTGIIGVIFSAYLTYLEAFVIKAWCQWCILSAWLTVGILIIAVRTYRKLL